VKISGIHSCTQEPIGGGEVRVMRINLGPLRYLMPTGMEHCHECNNNRVTKVVSDMICAPCFIVDVEMKLLYVC
jgi:hypothetical protein